MKLHFRSAVAVWMTTFTFQQVNAFTIPTTPSPEISILVSSSVNDQTRMMEHNVISRLPTLPQDFAFSSSTSILSAVASPSATATLTTKTTTPTTTTSTVPSPTTSTTTSTIANQSQSPLAITNIQYDGQVPKTESDEYVVLTNQSKNSINIGGYYIYVASNGTQGATYTFPSNTVLSPGTSVRIYTNEIHPETGGYSFGSKKAIWNNQGGLAVLKDVNGKKLGEFKYAPPKKTA